MPNGKAKTVGNPIYQERECRKRGSRQVACCAFHTSTKQQSKFQRHHQGLTQAANSRMMSSDSRFPYHRIPTLWTLHMPFSPSLIWFLIGVAFLAAELALPGFILIFFTGGSWVTAITAHFIDLDTTGQITLFVISSLISLVSLRKYSLATFRGRTAEKGDDRGKDTKIGKTGIVTKKISPTTPGEVKLMGSFWRAIACVAIAEGTPVTVSGSPPDDHLTVIVEPLKENTDE